MITEEEFTSIVNATKKTVLAAISRTVPSEYYHAIDDIVQEAYIRAYRSLLKGAFRHESSYATWLYTIARNESLRMMKKLISEEKKRAREKERQIHSLREEESRAADPDLAGYIALLPEKQKAVVTLYLDGIREKEIARRLGIAAGTVKSRLSRARERLRQRVRGGENNE